MKLFFGHNVGPEASLEHLDRVRRQTEEDLAQYRVWEEELEEWMEQEPASRAAYCLVVLRGGVLYSRMMLQWCDESAQTLRSLQRPDESRASKTTSSASGEDDR